MTTNRHPRKASIDAWIADTTLKIERECGSDWLYCSIDEVLNQVWKNVRLKSKVRGVTVDGVVHTFPEPLRVAPDREEIVYFLCPTEISRELWLGSIDDLNYMKEGLCHSTREAAEAHRKALIAVNGGVE